MHESKDATLTPPPRFGSDLRSTGTVRLLAELLRGGDTSIDVRVAHALMSPTASTRTDRL